MKKLMKPSFAPYSLVKASCISLRSFITADMSASLRS
jgi:hypothetical protein